MYGYIYKTTNLYNGKIYIGQHKSDKFNPNYYGSGIRFQNIFKKYGKDSFKCEMLQECFSEDELNEREIYWIQKLNATDRNIGYNLMSGGYKVRGIKHSPETIKKISKSKKGHHPNREYVVTDEVRQQISNTLKEYYKTHDNPKKGVKLSNETKAKLRKANLGKKQSEETIAKRRGKPAWNKGIPMSDEAKENLRQKNLGKKYSEETKEKHRKAMQGENNPNYGGLKEETKRKLSQSIKGRIWITDGTHCKQINPEDAKPYFNNGWYKGRIIKK